MNAVSSSKKIRDLLKIEKSTCNLIEDAPGYLVETWTLPNGKQHREYGPAFTDYYKNGQKGNVCYYLNGEVHREDGPACIYYSIGGSIESESWHLHGQLHRTDGPAYITRSQDGVPHFQYFLNGTKYEFSDWQREVAKRNF